MHIRTYDAACGRTLKRDGDKWSRLPRYGIHHVCNALITKLGGFSADDAAASCNF